MKDNIYCHNLRLNLNVQEQLDLHGSLMNFDKQQYKSKNAYMIEVLNAGVAKMNEEAVHSVLTKEQMQRLEDRITERIKTDVLNEVLKSLLGVMVKPSALSLYQGEREEPEETEVDAGLADLALDYFEE